jgi:hypothetical protein
MARLSFKGRVALSPVLGMLTDKRVAPQAKVVPGTAPSPGGWGVCLLGATQRVLLDVPHDVQDVRRRFNQRRSKAAFPQRATASMPSVEVAYIAAAQRLHSPSQTICLLRRGQEVDVPILQSIGMNSHRVQAGGLAQGVEIGLPINIVQKNSLPVIAALQDVVRLSCQDQAGKSSHGQRSVE